MNVRFRQIPSQTAAMNGKNNSCSLCYGFIFNLLVALCTIGFLCYFLYRFDARLVTLERRVWNKEHGDGRISTKERIGSYGQASQHKQAILMRKARTGFNVRLSEAKQLKKLIIKEQSRPWSNKSQSREISGQVRQSHSKEFMNTYGFHTEYNLRPPGDAFVGERINARNARVTRVVAQRIGGKNATKPSNS